MRRLAFTLLCSASLAFSVPGGTASPADLRVKAPINKAPKATPVYSWTGWYVGSNIGGAWSDVTLTDSSLGVGLNAGGTGFVGGVQSGYNFQTGNFLFGVEGDFDWTTFRGTSGPISTPLGLVHASDRKDWITTLAARLGVTSDRLLVYGKAGGGWARSSAALNLIDGGTIWGGSQTNGGWLLGTGIEYAFADSWTGKLEYDFLGMSKTTASAPTGATASHDVQMLKVGVNYQFGERVPAGAASGPSSLEAHDDDALATASQNPISSMITVPFENNANFGSGPFHRTQDVLDIQPVIPIPLNSDWNLIARTIAPLMSQPDPIFDSNTNGIGDITEELFFSPTHPAQLTEGVPFIWGVGPLYTMPSASDPLLGTGKTLAGPTAVALVTPKHWVIGVLVNNQWSIAGDPNRKSVNAFLAQPFVNYNMAGGWYLVSSPMITADWTAPSGQQWTVPLGGGFGRVFKVSGQAYSAAVQAFYNVAHPDNAAKWQLRLYLALLFPK
jgi:opacity protein-like surface antigen